MAGRVNNREMKKRNRHLPTGQQFFYSLEFLFRVEGDYNFALSLWGSGDVNLGRQVVLDGLQALGDIGWDHLGTLFLFKGGGILLIFKGFDQFFGLPHRNTVGDYLLVNGDLVLFLFDVDQGPSVAHGDKAVPHARLYNRVQFQQPKVIGDRGTFFSYPVAQFFLGDLDLIDQALIGQGDLYGIQILSLDVFHQGHFQGLLVVGNSDIGWNGLQADQF